MNSKLTSLASLSLLAGCAQQTDLENSENVAAWANSASALATFLPIQTPLEVAEGHTTLPDATCPEIDVDGETTTLTGGGCTDSDGTVWKGSATVAGQGEGWEVGLDGWGSGDEDAATFDGTWDVDSTGQDAWDFTADWTQDGLVTLDVDYAGSVEGTFGGPTLWNGAGTIERDGFTDAVGVAEASTVDQLRDGALCNNQNASGSTTIAHDGDVIVVTYDGAEDCDEAQDAEYSLNGEPQGSVEGITCAHAGRAGAASAWLLAAAGLAGLVRRRRQERG